MQPVTCILSCPLYTCICALSATCFNFITLVIAFYSKLTQKWVCHMRTCGWQCHQSSVPCITLLTYTSLREGLKNFFILCKPCIPFSGSSPKICLLLVMILGGLAVLVDDVCLNWSFKIGTPFPLDHITRVMDVQWLSIISFPWHTLIILSLSLELVVDLNCHQLPSENFSVCWSTKINE